MQFLRMLAEARVRESPPLLKKSARLAWEGRWSRVLAITCARAFASSLMSLPASAVTLPEDGLSPLLADVFAERRNV